MQSPTAKFQTGERACHWPSDGESDDTGVLQAGALPNCCPVCRRDDALLVIGGVVYCAACGYASDSARGCT